jgi:hypothetical protein
MKHNLPSLQVNICEVDGTTTLFLANAAAGADSLPAGFQPAEIFNQDTLSITDEDSITSFPVAKITRIELVCDELAHLICPVGLVEAVELTGEEFHTLIRNPALRKQWGQPATLADSLIAFLEVQMSDGCRFFLAMEIPPGDPMQTWNSKGVPWNGSSLCFRLRAGGVAVLNLAHLAHVTFLPTPPVDAWQVRPAPPAPVPF